jgi:elongation factor 2
MRFTVENVREMMESPENVRNITVIAHIDAGKTTTTDSLVSKAGIISSQDAGDKRYMDVRNVPTSRTGASPSSPLGFRCTTTTFL